MTSHIGRVKMSTFSIFTSPQKNGNLVICCILLLGHILSPLSREGNTVVPALGDHRRERPPAVCRHLINVPTHFNVKLPPISGHLPNADADSHLLGVSTCYNGQCKQMPRFRWSFQPKIAGAYPNLRLIVRSNVRAIAQRAIFYVIESNEPRDCGKLVAFLLRHHAVKVTYSVFQPAMSKKGTIFSSSLDQRCCGVWTKHIV